MWRRKTFYFVFADGPRVTGSMRGDPDDIATDDVS